MRALLAIASLSCIAASAQDALPIARELANESTRKSAVARIVASGNKIVPVLLSLTREPPTQVHKFPLYVGLADVFGQLKTKEAIPFLIKNIGLERGLLRTPNTSMKTAEVIQQRMPAIAALVQIGPEASRAVMDAFPRIDAEDRIWAIIVVSQIRGVPEARSFLSSVAGEANLERFWALEGLKAVDAGR